jgi:acetyl esterase/lipase
MKVRKWAALLIVSLSGTGVGQSTSPTRYLDTVFARVNVTHDLVYGKSALPGQESRELLLDLYQPEGDVETKRAAIVWVHGGGFFQGNKSDPPMAALARDFALRGYVTVSIDYRLERKNMADQNLRRPMLDAMEDARAAVRWLRAHAVEYRIGPKKIAIGGGSAGAFTSLLVAYDEAAGEGESGNPGYSSKVSAVVDFWGGLLDVKVMNAGGPPLLIIHGTQDAVVPFRLAENLARRAKEVGIPCEFQPLEGEGHAAWGRMKEYIAWIAPFLFRYVIQAGVVSPQVRPGPGSDPLEIRSLV